MSYRRSLRTDERLRTKAALDRLCSAKVKARDGYRCRICGSGQSIQWAHLFSRRYLNTRWDLENSWALCRRCHYRYTKRPDEWASLLELRLGREAYEALRARAFALVKPDYSAVRLYLESV